jgi:hypothetical protein
MKNFKVIEDKLLESLQCFDIINRDEAVIKFSYMWNDIDSYIKHINKRIKNGDISNEYAYVLKTFEVLAYSHIAYIESYPKNYSDVWDRVFYHQGQNWVVIIGENGKVLTSYKISGDIIDALDRHKIVFDASYERKEVSNGFSKRVKEIYERLTNL